jgi:hypothetical protein
MPEYRILIGVSMQTEIEKEMVSLFTADKIEPFVSDESAKEYALGFIQEWKTKAKQMKITSLRFMAEVFRIEDREISVWKLEDPVGLPN